MYAFSLRCVIYTQIGEFDLLDHDLFILTFIAKSCSFQLKNLQTGCCILPPTYNLAPSCLSPVLAVLFPHALSFCLQLPAGLLACFGISTFLPLYLQHDSLNSKSPLPGLQKLLGRRMPLPQNTCKLPISSNFTGG